MAPAKSASAVDARSRGRSRDEWSCCVCTLLNNWRERRCGACDSERPADAHSQPIEWSCEVCTLVNEWAAQRCAACEHERPAPTTSSAPGTTLKPPQSPSAARVLGTKESVAPGATKSPPRASRKRALSPTVQRTNGAQAAETVEKYQPPTIPSSPCLSHVKNEATDATATHGGVEDAAPSVEELPEAPTFNLLSFITGPVPSLEQDPTECHAAQDAAPSLGAHAGSPSFNLLSRPMVDLTEASRDEKTSSRAVDDSEIELAKAGLELSDSESDGDDKFRRREKRLLRRRRSLQHAPTTHPSAPDTRTQSAQGEWECPICTNSNPAHAARCELCNTRRDPPSASDSKMSEQVSGSDECPVCTHMNPESASACDVCATKISAVDPDTTSFTCIVCTNINPGHLDQCEMCETKRHTVACAVCTTLNAVNRKRCEVCESILDGHSSAKEPTSNAYIDLAVSQNDDYGKGKSRYGGSSSDSDSRIDQESVGDFDDDFNDRDFDHRDLNDRAFNDPHDAYATTSTSNVFDTNRRQNYQHRDDIEDISDNEMYGRMPAEIHEPAHSRRPELREFEHFLTVDDARLDYQCQIDYRSMFAESSRSRSYADRLQKRRRESQKRKRGAAENPNGRQLPGAKAGGKKKASKAGGKRAKAAERRASTGRPSSKSAKKPRKEAKPRRSSAPAFDGGINHYDAAGEDFGVGVTTMAWEGVGSAGYF